jgi:acetyl esterase/lipase
LVQAQTPIQDQIYLWPGTAPGSGNVTVTETISDRDPNGGDCYLNRAVDKVTQPSLKAFYPANPNGTAVVLCPGGGYARLAYDKEGYNIAEWFAERDITAFVLKYRLPIDGHDNRAYVPLQDAQRAMRYLRAHADSLNLDPDAIGIMGGSAGGHLAASLSVFYDWEVYAPVDSVDSLSAKPDFTVLMYPVISFQDSLVESGSRNNLLGSAGTQALKDSFSTELHVTPQTPPAFLFHSRADGSVTYRNSVAYARALDSAGVAYSLNLYDSGGHGIGKCEAGTSGFAGWPVDLDLWLAQEGWANACLGTPASIGISPDDSTVLVSTPASGYQWYRNSIPIAGATDSTYDADGSGYYRVETGGQRETTQTGCEVFSNEIILDICNGFIPSFSVAGDQLTSDRSGRFQWFLNGVPIPGATQRVYTATDTGTYVLATVNTYPISGEECLLFSDPVVVQTLTHIRGPFAKIPLLFPNPTSSDIHLDQLPMTSVETSYSIFDAKGSLVEKASLQVRNASANIDVSRLNEGLYHLIIAGEGHWLRGRFVKQ